MKKSKKLLSLLLAVLMLASILPLSALATEPAVSAFDDLPEEGHWALPGISFCVERGLMKGVDKHHFAPDAITTRAQMITILWRMSGSPNWMQRYDIPRPLILDLTQDWYKTAVDWAFRVGLTKGTHSKIEDINGFEMHMGWYFEPDAPVTREQLVTFLHRYTWTAVNVPAPSNGDLSQFPDAGSVSDWASDAMRWAVGNDILHGTNLNGTAYLDPQGYATRAQIATLMQNFVLALAASNFSS